VGLGYITLGQGSHTLSGGEAQRVKLAFYLSKANPHKDGGTVFIFDEPTTGLHFHDIKKLMNSFNALIDKGNTILCIEHNLDVIKCADWVLDLGPEAGENGGELLFAGIPEDLVKEPKSFTGKYLKDKL
jgi:excinuclease ABC subunit A